MSRCHIRTISKWLETIPSGTVFKSEPVGRGAFSLTKGQVSYFLKQMPDMVECIEDGRSLTWRRL